MNEERAILPRRYQNWTGSVYFVDDAGNGAYRCYFHPKDKPEAKAQIGPLPNDYLITPGRNVRLWTVPFMILNLKVPACSATPISTALTGM